jgi:hypothetical protein
MPTQAIETHVLGGLTLVLFPASRLSVFAVPIPGRAGEFAPIAPGVVLQQSGGIAALNGPMFENCANQDLPSGNVSYSRSVCSNLRSFTSHGVIRYVHLDTKRGLNTGGGSADGITISVVAGAPIATRGGVVPQGATAAVQGYPPLVWNGQNVTTTTLNTGAEWRSGLAIMSDGRLALAIGAMSMTAFADALIAAGALYALYTDGGGSTSLVLPNGTRKGASEGRKVGSWLVVSREAVIPPGLGQILSSPNAKTYGLALTAAAIVAIAYAASRREW